MQTAARMIEALSQLGVTVKAVASDRLRIEPASKVPPDLVVRVREAKQEILVFLRRRRSIKNSKPTTCRHDWIRDYRGIRLQCVVHKNSGGGNTVFRTNFGEHDTLADMLEPGVLTGEALVDAQRLN